MSHACANLVTDDVMLLPAAATVYMQAVEVRTRDTCGFNMSMADQHRWTPAFTAGAVAMCFTLAGALLVMLTRSEAAEVRTQDVCGVDLRWLTSIVGRPPSLQVRLLSVSQGQAVLLVLLG